MGNNYFHGTDTRFLHWIVWGNGTETRGFDNVFPPDDLFPPDTELEMWCFILLVFGRPADGGRVIYCGFPFPGTGFPVPDVGNKHLASNALYQYRKTYSAYHCFMT